MTTQTQIQKIIDQAVKNKLFTYADGAAIVHLCNVFDMQKNGPTKPKSS